MKGGERGDTLQSRYYRNASKPLREAGQEPGEGRKSDFDKDRFIYMNRGQEGQKTGSIVSDCRVRVKYCIAT
jgi:hypothetical protein